MKKRCCSCIFAITQDKYRGFRTNRILCCDHHNRACCISKLSLESDANIQIYFTDKQVSSRSQSNSYKIIDPKNLMKLFRKNYSSRYNDSESFLEAKSVLDELRRFRTKTCDEFNKVLPNCFDKREDNLLII